MHTENKLMIQLQQFKKELKQWTKKDEKKGYTKKDVESQIKKITKKLKTI